MARVFNRTKEKNKRRFLRKSMPEAEIILWSKLKGKQLGGYKFRRQVSVGRFVIDFYCPSKKIAVEIDGDSHFTNDGLRKDVERQQWVEQFGVRFLRFTNDEIRRNLDGVLLAIEQALTE
ncbi:MAG: endonuclease domain-containing protein [Ignavibacteriales bacterium]|nr:endonuclease domain-containing protein [Ignavibacteriales bacterium]